MKILTSWPRALTAGLILAFISAVCVAIVLSAEQTTSKAININRQLKMESMMTRLLPESASPDQVKLHCRLVSAPGIGNKMPAYIAIKDNGQTAGYLVVYSTSRGYTNPLILIAGLDHNRNLYRNDIQLSKETPGIGDKVERRHSKYLDQYNGLKLSDKKWDVKKFGGDFDYITGATVTSRAIVLATHDMLSSFRTLDLGHMPLCKE